MQSDAGRQLFDTAFNYINYHPLSAVASIAGIELLDLEVHEQTNFALVATVGIDPRTQRLFLLVNGDPQRVTAMQTHEYTHTFMRVLAAITRAPQQSLDFDADELVRDTTPPPRSPVEAELADLFASVLGVDSVGVHDNFFTIGGDSILALVVRSKAEKRGISFDIDDMFARPTVAELAESTSRPAPEPRGVTEPFALVPLIDRAALHEAEDAFPATTLQLGMLFHSIQRAESTMYKDVFHYRVAIPWREDDFADAFDALVARHPALRSSFELTRHSVPLQVVSPRVPRAFARRGRGRRCTRRGLRGRTPHAPLRPGSRSAIQPTCVCPRRRCGSGLRVSSRDSGRLERREFDT